jgi:hypothetical protein
MRESPQDRAARRVSIEFAQEFVGQHCSHMCIDRKLTAYSMTRDLILDAIGAYRASERSRIPTYSVN